MEGSAGTSRKVSFGASHVTLDGSDYLGELKDITWGDWEPVCLTEAKGPWEEGRGGQGQSTACLVLRTKSKELTGVSQRSHRLRREPGQGRESGRKEGDQPRAPMVQSKRRAWKTGSVLARARSQLGPALLGFMF